LPRRTIRKPTRWSPEEWDRIEEAAHACGVAPLRYIREAALRCPFPEGTAPAPRPTEATDRADEAANQLGRILNNVRQLVRVAELDGDCGGAAVLLDAAGQVEDAVLRLPSALRRDTADALASLVEAGIGLNTLAHRANCTEEVPSKGDLFVALMEVEAAVRALVP
jgi:hypothetical protein